jgi:hypothetical protein
MSDERRGARLRGAILRRAALIIGAVLLTLVLLEIGVRTIPLYPTTFAIADPVLGWRFQPGTEGVWFNVLCPREFTNQVRINTRGAHDIEHTAPPADRQLLVVGDSLVASLEIPVEQTFFRLMHPLLNQRAPTDVIAAGHTGFSTGQEWLYVQEYIERYGAPDAVLLLFTPHNDFNDNHPVFAEMLIDWVYTRPYYQVGEDGELIAIGAQPVPLPPIHRLLLEWSALYRLLSARARALQPPIDLTGETFAQARADTWRVTFALLDAFSRTLSERGIAFGVAIDQSILRIEERRPVHERLLEGLAERGIPAVSLLDPFQQAEESGVLVRYSCDTHWTPQGHRIAAEVIAPFAESLLADRPASP